MDICLNHLESRITGDMNDRLLRSFMEDEVSFALSQLLPLKSPGWDGFVACFYQKSWGTGGNVVSKAVLNYLNGGPFDGSINSTNIVLIPKVSYSSRLSNYMPISLCNVLYKLVAKVLANCLKLVLPMSSPQNKAFLFRVG